MSPKWVPRALAEIDPLAVKGWFRRAPAVLGSLLHAVTKPRYRGAAAGAAIAVVILGLLMLFVPGSVLQRPAGAPLATPLQHQGRHHQPAAPGHPGQHHPGQVPEAAASGQVAASAWTPSPDAATWLYPTGRPDPLADPSPSPTLSLPAPPSPTPTLTMPTLPAPSPSSTLSPPASSSP